MTNVGPAIRAGMEGRTGPTKHPRGSMTLIVKDENDDAAEVGIEKILHKERETGVTARSVVEGKRSEFNSGDIIYSAANSNQA
jgi:hypothetical protein